MADYQGLSTGVQIDDTVSKVQNLQQNIGNSTTNIMSQNAVTEFVNSRLINKTLTLPHADWSGSGSDSPYTKVVTVADILVTDNPDIDLDFSNIDYENVANAQNNWSKIYRAVTSENSITFCANEVPLMDLPLKLKVVR